MVQIHTNSDFDDMRATRQSRQGLGAVWLQRKHGGLAIVSRHTAQCGLCLSNLSPESDSVLSELMARGSVDIVSSAPEKGDDEREHTYSHKMKHHHPSLRPRLFSLLFLIHTHRTHTNAE